MAHRPLDRIHIRDLLLRCVVGVRDRERHDRQNVNLNITLHADLATACRTDELAETVDYAAIKKRVIELVQRSSFHLLEALAEAVANVCLEDPRVRLVDVTIEKPGALRFARTAAVQITRGSE